MAAKTSDESIVGRCIERMGYKVEIEIGKGTYSQTKLGYVTRCDCKRRIVYIDEEAILEDDIRRVRVPGRRWE